MACRALDGVVPHVALTAAQASSEVVLGRGAHVRAGARPPDRKGRGALRQAGSVNAAAARLGMSHELTIGAAAGCALQLSDPTRCVMRRHARLSSERSGWMLRDLDSTNGTRLDGARRAVFPLEPGVEVGIGRITLIAESRALVALHGFLARLLGFGADGLLARSEVDTSFDISRHAG